MVVVSGGQTQRSTSAAKYKTSITDAPYLKDIVLAPKKFYRDDDEKWSYGMIADPLAAQDSLIGAYGNTHENVIDATGQPTDVIKLDENEWELENYQQGAYNAIVAAKLNDLQTRLEALEP